MRNVAVVPLAAIREAVANALIHRDLGPNTVEAGKAIDVRITPDRLIITSPGGLKNLTVAQLHSADFRRIEVNQHLYRLAKILTDADGNRIIEGEGGGVTAMFELCEAAGLPRPRIINTGVKVTVIFFFPQEDHTPSIAQGKPEQSSLQHNNDAPLGNESPLPDIEPGVEYLRSLGKNVPKIVAAAQKLAAESTPLTPPGHSAGVSTGYSAEFSFNQ